MDKDEFGIEKVWKWLFILSLTGWIGLAFFDVTQKDNTVGILFAALFGPVLFGYLYLDQIKRDKKEMQKNLDDLRAKVKDDD